MEAQSAVIRGQPIRGWAFPPFRFAPCGLQPRRLAQGRIDAVLPAGAVLLEEVEHVAVEAQGDHLLRARQRRFALARDRLGRLGGRGLERRFRGGARVGRPAGSIGWHGGPPSFFTKSLRGREAPEAISIRRAMRPRIEIASSGSALLAMTRTPHCAMMWLSWTTWPHFSISLCMKAPNSVEL